MNYYIITGTSKGLGEAIALKLIKNNTHLFCISRKRNESLIEIAKNAHCSIDYHSFDLYNINLIDDLIQSIIEKIDSKAAETITLINNAGILSPIKPIERCSSSDIVYNFHVNTIAPIILTAQFIKKTKKLKCKRTVINISSGAGKNPYSGWSSYCSSKAAIDMFTRTVGLEQTNSENQVKIFSFAPGVIDTEMQTKIRETSAEDFESVERFKAYKKDGKLLKPAYVAEKLITLMNMSDLKQGGIYDIKDI